MTSKKGNQASFNPMISFFVSFFFFFTCNNLLAYQRDSMSILNDLIGTFNSAVESVTETYNTVSTSSFSNRAIQVNGQTIWITKLLSEG